MRLLRTRTAGLRSRCRVLATTSDMGRHAVAYRSQVADVRACEQCGAVFTPRREHARFCSARCRAGWNLENTADPADPLSALNWAITAMRDTTRRLPGVEPGDWPHAFAEISEAVWWVTIVDATLMRHHPRAYDRVLAARAPAERQLIEETLAGLRYVRNQISQDAGFVHPGPFYSGDGRLTAWTWNPVPEPPLASLLPRARQWEMTRYRAYQARLAGCTVGEVFERSAAFLERVAAGAQSVTSQGRPVSAADISDRPDPGDR